MRPALFHAARAASASGLRPRSRQAALVQYNARAVRCSAWPHARKHARCTDRNPRHARTAPCALTGGQNVAARRMYPFAVGPLGCGGELGSGFVGQCIGSFRFTSIVLGFLACRAASYWAAASATRMHLCLHRTGQGLPLLPRAAQGRSSAGRSPARPRTAAGRAQRSSAHARTHATPCPALDTLGLTLSPALNRLPLPCVPVAALVRLCPHTPHPGMTPARVFASAVSDMLGLHAGPLKQALSGAVPGFVAERRLWTSAWGISAGTRGGRLP